MARMLGSRGGHARAKRLTSEERKRIAALGGHARKQSLEAARRLEVNLRYAASMIELRGGQPKVTRVKTSKGPLPGIYSEA